MTKSFGSGANLSPVCSFDRIFSSPEVKSMIHDRNLAQGVSKVSSNTKDVSYFLRILRGMHFVNRQAFVFLFVFSLSVNQVP